MLSSIMKIWPAMYSLTVDSRNVVVPVVPVYPFCIASLTPGDVEKIHQRVDGGIVEFVIQSAELNDLVAR